jgi:hypothetical protein
MPQCCCKADDIFVEKDMISRIVGGSTVHANMADVTTHVHLSSAGEMVAQDVAPHWDPSPSLT